MTSAGSFAAPKGLTVGLSQLNPLVGDLLGNEGKILADYAKAQAAGCDVVVYPELTITGYPPEDLLLKKAFVRDNELAVQRIAARTKECAALIGFVKADGDQLFNAVALCRNGGVQDVYLKQLLPNYAVFDEDRYFTPGPAMKDDVAAGLFSIDGITVGVTICEDIWYADGPVAAQAAAGARIMLNLNASPFHEGKNVQREQMLSTRAKETNSAIVYVNQVGAQDELVFDGSSVVVDCNGVIACRLKSFESDFSVVTIGGDGTVAPTHVEPFASDLDRVYDALVVGTRDYVHKNGFTDVVIGLSGGIDSSIVAAIAVDALGADQHRHAVFQLCAGRGGVVLCGGGR